MGPARPEGLDIIKEANFTINSINPEVVCFCEGASTYERETDVDKAEVSYVLMQEEKSKSKRSRNSSPKKVISMSSVSLVAMLDRTLF